MPARGRDCAAPSGGPPSTPVLETAPSLLILGTDAVLAAAPATAVQLTHACTAAGFDAVVPASWGDEIVASRVLEKLAQARTPTLLCACPRVADRLHANVDLIAEHLVCTVSPAVAAAEYLRALYAPARPVITFAGGCEGGGSEVIDRWLRPAELLELLASRGIVLAAQPLEFEALPADRRRFHSEPGGLPCRASLRQVDGTRAVELHGEDLVAAVGQHLLGEERVLIDIAAAVGCACAGAVPGVPAAGARARVREHEPPRAPSAVVDHRVRVAVDVATPLPASARPTPDPGGPGVAERAAVAARADAAAASPPPESARRRSPPSLPRPVFGAAPRVSRADGRILPRAYIARRRSSPRGVPTVPAAPEPSAARSGSRSPDFILLGTGVVAGAAMVGLLLLFF